MGDFGRYLVLNNTVMIFYVLFILLPSVTINGIIITMFVKIRELRTPFNLFTINQSISGIVSNFINPFLFLVVNPIALSYDSCAVETVLLATYTWTHYGVNAFNFATISIGIYATLKRGSKFVTYKKVIAVLLVTWIYPLLWSVVLSYLVREVVSHRCLAYTDHMVANISDGDPTAINPPPSLEMILSFIARDLAIDMVTRVLVLVFCIASYRLFKSSTIDPPPGLTKKMLLLPILMSTLLTVITLFSGISLIAINGGYGNVPVSVEQYETSPLLYIQFVSQLLLEYDALIYACLLIYLNSKMLSTFKAGMKKFNRKLHATIVCHKRNRVLPSNS